MKYRRLAGQACATVLTGTLAACGGDGGPDVNKLPSGVTEVSATAYPATARGTGATADTQDLLTGGLGKTGLMGATPTYADPTAPTAAELRRNALYSNYRGIVDYTANGGFGKFWGPNVATDGSDTGTEGLVPGKEYVAYVDDGSGNQRSVIAVQVPDSFNPDAPCVVLGPSSGSRGVYGAIGTAGEWGLKHGCAVALAEGGRGMGLYDPGDDTVNRIDGTRATRSAAGNLSHFAAQLTDTARAAFNAAFPNRLALKHAHSQTNPERRWGSDTLAAGHYALYVLNQLYGKATSEGAATKEVRFTRKNTLVIAASVSNGGTSVLQAAEQDDDGLIDGVVAGEPGAQPGSDSGWSVQLGGATVPSSGRSLYDYFTVANLYQPCAALAAGVTMAETSLYNYIPFAGMTARATNRCAALAARGLVAGATTAEQSADALAKLRAYGWSADSDTMHNAHYGLGNAAIITMMYANAYGRFSVADNVCGLSLAQVGLTGDVIAPLATSKAQSFAIGNGTANGSPASVVYNQSVGGAKSWAFGVSPTSNTADFSLDSALCLRALATGTDPATGAALTAATVPTLAQAQAVQAGIRDVLLTGKLRRTPTVLVAGRSDALLPVNHTSRAYAAFSQSVDGSRSNLRYIEVTNGQHFDAFLPFSGFDTRFVPVHVYFNQALDAMWAHLKNGTALPPSQVVRTTPRGGTPGAAPALTATNVPAIATAPAAGDAITYSGGVLSVPN